MSEGVRKNLRTQGKYSDGRIQKNGDKKQKSSISSKDTSDTRYQKKNSGGTKGINSSLSDEGASPYKYEEHSDYAFRELEEVTKPEEIKDRGKKILSKTENGESIIHYEPYFLQTDEGDEYFDRLYQTINFDARNIVIHGVEYPQPRLVAWFGPFEYKYSGTTLEPAEMPDVVLEIKQKVEESLKSQNMEASFNSVLINLYRDGKDSVAWHSDDELMLGMSPTIASVSLGETRKFQMRPKIKNHDGHSPDNPTKYFVHLIHGSLIVMTGSMQDDWQHRVPKEYHDRGPRINLTFRTVYPLEEVIHLKKERFFRRKSLNRNPRKKIRLDYFDSPSSSCSKDTDESYDEIQSNRSFSSSFKSDDLSFSEKRDLCVDDEETYERRRKLTQKIQSPDFQKSPSEERFFRRKSCNRRTPQKKIRVDFFASPSSSCSENVDKSYNEIHSNRSFSISFEADDLSFSEKRNLWINDEETCQQKLKIRQKIRSLVCQKLRSSSQVSEKSENSDLFIVKERKDDNLEKSDEKLHYVTAGYNTENDKNLNIKVEDNHDAAIVSGVKDVEVVGITSYDEPPDKK